MQIELDADTTQLIAGTPLPTDASCTECDQRFKAGERCIVYTTHPEDAVTYTLERLYCADCAPSAISSPTRKTSEYLIRTRLTRTLDDRTQRTYHTLHEPQSIATSPLSEGTGDTPDEPTDPSALILATRIQEQEQELADAIYHIERIDETDTEGERTPLCNCSLNEEYTRISLAEAEASAARCCRNCRTAREGGQDTRSCLYCEEQIAVSRWPQHVRACTGDPTDAATETDPNGDPVITDSATAIHGTAPPATHRSVPVGAERSESTQE